MKFNAFHCLLITCLLLSYFLNLTEARSHTTNKSTKNKRNKYTAKHKSRLSSELSFKRTAAFEKLMAMRVRRDDEDIPDPFVVYRIAFASHKKEGASCPYPLTLAESLYEGTSGDLNEGKGGDYIYLCVGRKRVSELTGEESFINQIHLNTNQHECGKLTLVKSTLKSSYFFSNEMSLCVGYSDTSSPWSKIKVFRRKDSKSNVPSQCKLEITEGKFLCYETADEAPRKIEFTDLSMLRGEVKASALGKPEVVAEIDNDNSSGKADNTIKRSLWLTKVKSSSWNLENKFTHKVDVKITVGVPIVESGKFTATGSFEMSTSENKGAVTNDTDLEMIDFNCLAPKGKYYKCRATLSKVEASMPYEVKRTVTMYNGKKNEKVVKSNFEGIMSSSVQFERCCYMNCDPKTENVCTDWVKDPSGLSAQCPKLDGVTPEAPIPTKEQTVNIEDKFVPEVITDIKVIIGFDTTCPHGYEHVNENDSNDRGDWDHASFNSNKRFICILKQKVTELESPPINVVKVSKNNKDCGTLNQASTSLTEPEENYLCYGNDATIKLAPLRELRLVTIEFFSDKNKVNSIKDLEFDDLLVKDRYYLGLIRENNAPKKVQITEIKYDFTQMKKQPTGPPKRLKEVIVSSATLTETVKVTKRSETSLKTSVDVGKSVGLIIEGKIMGVTSVAGYNANSKNTQTTENKQADENMNVTTVDCIAQDKKVIKCMSTVIEYRVSIPYTAKMKAFDYQGHEMPAMSKEIKGVSEEIGTSNIIVRNCCLDGCCTGNESDKEQRPHCWDAENLKSKGKDITCAEIDKCFEEKKSKRRKLF